MIKQWRERAWEDYLYWQTQDKKTIKRIHMLLKDIERNGYHGIGKPEPLQVDLKSLWSVRIDEKNRLVFRIEGDILELFQCGSHYRNK
ncbi:MAG: Txe/YoeB family addiction module toxin [Defluviitaleaceae bacterium]|nr:Txe/YoeB family addiction module toxin [Defluviitaleaceae bacterium]